MDTFRETCAGQFIYLASGKRLLRYQEERPDYKLPERYQHDEKKEEQEQAQREERERLASIPNAPGYPHVDRRFWNDSDSERTRTVDNGSDEETRKEDKNLVDWYGDDDPDNPVNW